MDDLDLLIYQHIIKAVKAAKFIVSSDLSGHIRRLRVEPPHGYRFAHGRVYGLCMEEDNALVIRRYRVKTLGYLGQEAAFTWEPGDPAFDPNKLAQDVVKVLVALKLRRAKHD